MTAVVYVRDDEVRALRQQLEVEQARAEAALGYVKALLRMVRGNEYTTTEEQKTMRGARALVAEQEGK